MAPPTASFAEEIRHAERAAAARPDDAAAWLDLALARHRAGRADPAAQACAVVLRLAPGHPGAMWLQARLALDRGRAAAALRLTAEVLHHPGLAPAQRAETLLLHGQACDAAGEPVAGFAAAAAGKAIEHRLHAATAAAHESEAARYRRLTAWFDAHPDAIARAAPPPATGLGHVFLVGFPRSGTTLLEQVLAGHPAVSALEEAPTLAAHQRAFLADDAGCARLAALGDDEAADWRARYWAAVREAGGQMPPAGGVFLDKAPAGTLWLPLVARLFPGARVLFALRDPRDVVLSCLRSAFRMNVMTYAFTSLAGAAGCYDACMAMAEVYRRVLPLTMTEVRHEAFVADPAGELARVAAFIGLDADPAQRARMLDVATTAARRPAQTPSAPQLQAGINARGLGRWRAVAAEMAPVLPVLAPWAARFGYPE